jgi:membrane-bound ClpP family serine protease
MARILLIIGLICVVLWLLGLVAFHITTPVLHALIIIGLILIILDLSNNRRNWW